MSHSAVLGGVEIPVTWSKSEAVGLFQLAGIVGAGGAGFPTYVKFRRPPRVLLVNGADSEPGFYADKLLLRDEPEALVDVFEWLKATFSMEVMVIGVEEVARPYLVEFERLARRLRSFSVAYVPSEYRLGQERALCKAVLGIDIPSKGLPSDRGVVVNNNETMFNVYRAVFRDRPVLTKFLQVYGEATPLRVYEAPVGTLAADLLRIHGRDPGEFAACRLYDGGPILAECVADPMGVEPLVPVKRTTNAFLVVDPGKDRPRKAFYPDPRWAEFHNSVDAPWAPDRIVNVEDRVRRVRVPLTGKFWKRGPLRVEVGDVVARGDSLAEPALSGLSVGVHASIGGRVTAVTEEFVEIVR